MICITDNSDGVDIETFPLWDDHNRLRNPNGAHLPSCYRRLKIFDPMTLSELDIEEGSPVVSLDLDVVFIKDIVPLIDTHDVDFLGWKGPGALQPVVYNGTFFRFKAGKMASLWNDFDPETSPLASVNAHYFGSDQGWLSYKLNGSVPGLTPRDGILSYSREVRHDNAGRLPSHARIVSFNGKTKPWDANAQFECPWIKKYWRL